jgi:hypothetical protein
MEKKMQTKKEVKAINNFKILIKEVNAFFGKKVVDSKTGWSNYGDEVELKPKAQGLPYKFQENQHSVWLRADTKPSNAVDRLKNKLQKTFPESVLKRNMGTNGEFVIEIKY